MVTLLRKFIQRANKRVKKLEMDVFEGFNLNYVTLSLQFENFRYGNQPVNPKTEMN
jgi:hypothetical protein